MRSLNSFVQTIQGMVAHIGTTFQPDEDWVPTLFLQDYEDKVVICGIDPALFKGDEQRDLLARFIYSAILGHRGDLGDLGYEGDRSRSIPAVRAALVMTAWMVKAVEGEPLSARPSEHPDRFEVVTLVACDLEEVYAASARIRRRTNKPPLLLPWDDFSPDPEKKQSIAGPWVDIMRTSLHQVRTIAENPVQKIRELLDQSDEDDPMRELMTRMIEAAEQDPSLATSMPIAEWWRKTKGGA